MSLTAMEVQLLEDAADDAYGLWEVVWGIRTRYPELNELELIGISEQVIRGLLTRGFIALFLAITGTDRQVLEPVDVEELRNSLWATPFWQAPVGPGSREIWFETTQRGEQVLREAIRQSGSDRPDCPD